MNWVQGELTGWGRALRATSATIRPSHRDEVVELLGRALPSGVSLYGAGRSYGDSALNAGGHTCLTEGLNRILAFDESSGLIDVEPGVTFRQLIDQFLPRGWLAPVTPGTSFATLGGAVAHDVHGKNHEGKGSFGQHVIELDLLTTSGIQTIGPQTRPDWFRATCGGCGLTGPITRIRFRLARVPSAYVEVTRRRVQNLDSFLQAFEETRTATYSVGWLDALARGRAFGRGILETAEPAPGAGFAIRQPRPHAWPLELPPFAVDALPMGVLNGLYYRRVPNGGDRRNIPYASFLYPLDALLHWNRIYGRRGFHQFQCVVPEHEGARALRRLLEAASGDRVRPMLAVLKRFGQGRAGHLSFPMAGFTLALDFANKPGIEALYGTLVGITLDHGGRVYLAKDALLCADDFARMYPELPQFRRVIAELDPEARFQSDMARRLKIRG